MKRLLLDEKRRRRDVAIADEFIVGAGRQPNDVEVRIMRDVSTSEGPAGLADEDYVEPPEPAS